MDRHRAKIRLKRAYDEPSKDDGTRILVERLWPRGVRKDEAAIDPWPKELAPSTELRRWFGHDPARWTEFRRRYREELKSHEATLKPLRDALERGTVTLVFSARDEGHNQAVVRREFLAARKR